MSASQVKPPANSGGLSFIEQLQNKASRLCSNPGVPYLTGVNHSDGVAVLTRGSCKKWDCPSCGAREGQKWIARILHALNGEYAGKSWVFMTVTAPGWAGDRESSVRQIRTGWKRLYNRMRYRFGKSPYVRVYEPHALVDENTGEFLPPDVVRFHKHMLVTFPLTGIEKGEYEPFGLRDNGGVKRVKDVAVECGLGHQVDVRPVDNAGQVAGYIAKYIGKHLDTPDIYPKGMRRIECNNGFPALPDIASDYTWTVNETREGQDRNAEFLIAVEGVRVVDLRPDPYREAMAIELG